MSLENELVEVLLPHAGERQHDEGAVDCLKRIIAERDELRKALGFAQSCIRSGESWSPDCDEIIGGALAKTRPPAFVTPA